MPSPRRRPHNVVPFKRRHKKARWRAKVSPILIMAPLAVFTAVLLWDGGPPGLAMVFGPHYAKGPDTERAQFGRCHGRQGINCVIDGDGLMYQGRQIRIADMDTPEIGEPDCPEERALGQRAKGRLQVLLNAGPFTLQPAERSHDRYGRELWVITREGESVGQVLVREGLAHVWRGRREGWCG